MGVAKSNLEDGLCRVDRVVFIFFALVDGVGFKTGVTNA